MPRLADAGPGHDAHGRERHEAQAKSKPIRFLLAMAGQEHLHRVLRRHSRRRTAVPPLKAAPLEISTTRLPGLSGR